MTKPATAVRPATVALVKRYEGFSSTPYQCSADVWTIGYGSTRTPSGEKIRENTVGIDEKIATQWLLDTLDTVQKQVNRLITVPLTDNQRSALVSFTYNVGAGNLAASTLRQKLNREQYEEAAAEFPKWRMANGRVLKGLVRRRHHERALFLTPDTDTTDIAEEC